MRKLYVSFFIFTALLSIHITSAAVNTADRVVAVVNQGTITLRELNQKMQAVKHNLIRQKITLPADDILRDQVLERMITDMIQIQYAQQLGLRIGEEELDKALQKIAAQNKKSLPQFRTTLEKEGYLFDTFRNEVRQDILISHLREREIDSRILISEAEVSDWIKNQGNRPNNAYELAQILVPLAENASPEKVSQAQQKIEAAQHALAHGASFASVSAKYTNTALPGDGSLGWRAGASLPPSFVKILDSLAIGGVTEPIRTPVGIHIFKLLNRRTPQTHLVVPQTHARHILLRVNEFVSEASAMQRAKRIVERLQKGDKFEALARLYSEDSSAGKGGDLGWMNPKETVPEFEQAMKQLSIGQISQPIRTQFGIHLIQLIARRTHDVGQERERMQIQMELQQRKSDEQYQNWVMQLRDSAYVVKHLNE